MLSPARSTWCRKAELNGNVDSDHSHGGSSTTYVLHRTGCTQEDDQLLREGRRRPDRARRKNRGDAARPGLLDAGASSTLDGGDGSNHLYGLDLRSSAAPC